MGECEELMQVEEIIDTCLDKDGKRLYHVKWKPIWVSEEQLPTTVVENAEGEKSSVYVLLDERKNEEGVVEYLLSYSSTWEPEKKLIDSCPDLLSSFWSTSRMNGPNEVDLDDGSESDSQEPNVHKDARVVDFVGMEYGKVYDVKPAHHVKLNPTSFKETTSSSEYQPLFSSLSDMHDKEHTYGGGGKPPLPLEPGVGIVAILPKVPNTSNFGYNNVIYPVNYSGYQDFHATKTVKSVPKKRLCDKCGKYFSTKSNLNRHRKRCDGGRLFYCEICGENFAMSFSLILHQRSHTKELFRGDNGDIHNGSDKIWNDTVNSKNGNAEYENEAVDVKPTVVVTIEDIKPSVDSTISLNEKNILHRDAVRCQSEKPNCSDASIHPDVTRVNNIISQSEVKDCGDMSSISRTKNNFPTLKTPDKRNSWNNCNNNNNNNDDIDDDVDDGHSKIFTNSYTLREYQRIPSVSVHERRYECNKCWKQFSTKSNLNRHCKNCNIRKVFNCRFCDATFSSNFSLRYHENSHAHLPAEKVEKKERFHPCDVCNQLFSSVQELNKHRETHNKRGFFVDIKKDIDKKILAKPENKDLLRDIGKPSKAIPLNGTRPSQIVDNRILSKEYIQPTRGKRKYECSKCTKRFSTKSNLNRHVKNCSGAKVFKCNVCSLAFARSVNLKIHQKIHNNDNRYQCKVCQKQCLTSYALLEHERVHTGDRPYKCDDCGRQFTTKSNWKRHQVMYSCRKTAVVQDHHDRTTREISGMDETKISNKQIENTFTKGTDERQDGSALLKDTSEEQNGNTVVKDEGQNGTATIKHTAEGQNGTATIKGTAEGQNGTAAIRDTDEGQNGTAAIRDPGEAIVKEEVRNEDSVTQSVNHKSDTDKNDRKSIEMDESFDEDGNSEKMSP